ncbi:hypothetical protein BDV3_002506 [Batrachochytrium dendrobatidis]
MKKSGSNKSIRSNSGTRGMKSNTSQHQLSQTTYASDTHKDTNQSTTTWPISHETSTDHETHSNPSYTFVEPIKTDSVAYIPLMDVSPKCHESDFQDDNCPLIFSTHTGTDLDEATSAGDGTSNSRVSPDTATSSASPGTQSSIPHTIQCTHKCTDNNGACFRNSTQHIPSVAIFWDFENCAPPAAVPGYVAVQNIRKSLRQFGPIVQFRAYLEVRETFIKSMRSELQSSGCSVIDTPHNGRKDAADKMIMVDMLSYIIDTPAPATIVLISGDRDFLYALAVLQNRGYNVVLIVPNRGASPILRAQASIVLEWRYDIFDEQVVAQMQRDRDEATMRVSNLARSTSQLMAAGGSFENLVCNNGNTGWKSDFGSMGYEKRTAAPLNIHVATQDTGVEHSSNFEHMQEYENDIPAYSPHAPGYFDALMEILQAAKQSGLFKPSKAKIASELIARNPMILQRAGVHSMDDFFNMAVEAGLIRIGGIGPGQWMTCIYHS